MLTRSKKYFLVTGVLVYFQVIKYKVCRCMKKKHKGRKNNDRGAVLSLDDVKHHVSSVLLSTFTVSDGIALTGAHSLLCLHCSQLESRSRRWWGGGRKTSK